MKQQGGGIGIGPAGKTDNTREDRQEIDGQAAVEGYHVFSIYRM